MTILIDGFFNSFDVKNKIKTILNKAFHSNNKNTIIITYIKWNTKNNKNIWDILKNDIKYFITNNYIFDNISINVIKNNNNITSYIINILNKTYILKFNTIILDDSSISNSLNNEFNNYCLEHYDENFSDNTKFDFKLNNYIGIIINNTTQELYNIDNITNYDSLKIIINLLNNKIIVNI